MIYTVTWKPAAEEELARLWVASTDRQALASAADQIDRELREDPAHKGESRSGDARILILPPLQVTYRVLEEDRQVLVGAVKLLRQG